MQLFDEWCDKLFEPIRNMTLWEWATNQPGDRGKGYINTLFQQLSGPWAMRHNLIGELRISLCIVLFMNWVKCIKQWRNRGWPWRKSWISVSIEVNFSRIVLILWKMWQTGGKFSCFSGEMEVTGVLYFIYFMYFIKCSCFCYLPLLLNRPLHSDFLESDTSLCFHSIRHLTYGIWHVSFGKIKLNVFHITVSTCAASGMRFLPDAVL